MLFSILRLHWQCHGLKYSLFPLSYAACSIVLPPINVAVSVYVSVGSRSNKCYELDDICQNQLQGNTRVGSEGETVSIVVPSVCGACFCAADILLIITIIYCMFFYFLSTQSQTGRRQKNRKFVKIYYLMNWLLLSIRGMNQFITWTLRRERKYPCVIAARYVFLRLYGLVPSCVSICHSTVKELRNYMKNCKCELNSGLPNVKQT